MSTGKRQGVDEREADAGLVRCRLVARDFEGGAKDVRKDLLAATPPLESFRLLCSMC